MRIALVAPPWYAVPPRGYGGIEALVAGLADGLVARGHEVLLVSAGRNGTLAEGVSTLEEPAEALLGDEAVSLLHSRRVEHALRDFGPDVVHDHTLPGLLAAEYRPWPTVATVHGAPAGPYGELLRTSGHVHLVAISHAQRRSAPSLPWAATVHNGIAVRSYPFSPSKDDYLLFLGRMDPEKGLVEAIDVAERAGVPLVIAARLHGRHEEEYFSSYVRPRLGPNVEYVGEAGFEQKCDLLSRARALLFPLQWDEPYGLVVAEAQACGTPVLSLRRGAIPELVEHGRTGWLMDHHDALVGAVARVDDLDPRDCRQHALESLDISRSVRRYEHVLQWAVDAHARRPIDLRASREPGRTRLDDKAPALTHLLTKENS